LIVDIKENGFACKVIPALPLLLFFPIGLVYAGLLLFLLAWIVDGDFKKKWTTIRNDDLFLPFLLLISIIICNAIFLSSENIFRWPALAHYQIFFFYFLIISIGFGDWQRKGINVFICGAVFGSTLFYLAHLALLPDWSIFKNYAIYSGNKSISLGIFLAIAAALLLNNALNSISGRSTWLGFAGFAYIALAVLFLAKTRTGMLLLFLLSLLVIFRHLRFNLRGFALLASLLLIPLATWNSSAVFRERALSTIESVQAFSAGQMGSGQGNRLQFIVKTGEMIMEKPLLGHGVGSWLEQYPVRAKGLETALMTTPHNDYLLYTAELGAVGLLALLGVFGHLLVTAWRTKGSQGVQLMVIGTALMIGSAFNAILRDWKFGLPMMILLALVMTRSKYKSSPENAALEKNT